jgi:hypothetical protein
MKVLGGARSVTGYFSFDGSRWAFMPTLKAEFDGRVFVPCTPVDLAAGTKVEIILPSVPEKLTAAEMRQWQEIERQIAASPPYFPTLKDALQYTRKGP